MAKQTKVERLILMNEAVHALLHDRKTIQWHEFSGVCAKVVKIEPKGYMEVRGVLQNFINCGILVRTDDLRVEEYTIAHI